MNRKIISFACILTLSFLLGSCRKADDDTTGPDSSTPAKPAASPLTGFAKDLQFIKDGAYTYIYVFSRKDGKALESEDSKFLRKEAPQLVDCVTSDEGKKAICGTNFNLEEGNMGTLKKRLVVEDYTGK